jgi:cobyrinic acid a,c-diamide synthase
MITRTEVARKIAGYLQHTLSLEKLVDWAEQAMQEGEFDEAEADTLTEIVARLGVADVRAFGLTWDECNDFLAKLGYEAKAEVVAQG